jgi:hypothetical protein
MNNHDLEWDGMGWDGMGWIFDTTTAVFYKIASCSGRKTV